MFSGKSKREIEAAEVVPVQAKQPVAATPAPQQPARECAKNFIAAGTVIEGHIVSHEDLHLEGTVKGDIKTTALLVLGKTAVVEGNILSAQAVVAGRITGTVESQGLLTIKSTCVIDGDIITKSLNVESGSTFNGRCKVGGAIDKPAADAKPAVNNRLAPPVNAANQPLTPANMATSGSLKQA